MARHRNQAVVMQEDPRYENADLELGNCEAGTPAQVLRNLLDAKDLESFIFITAKRRSTAEPRPRRPSLRP
jgi:hypothetical protein